MRTIYKLLSVAFFVGMFSGCIKNDIDYPHIALSVVDMQVEGQQGNAVIVEKDRTVKLTVKEMVDLRKVRVNKWVVTEGAKSTLSANDVIDLSTPYRLTLSLYQDYDWTITAVRDVKRTYKVDNQVGVSEVDAENRLAVAYVRKDTKWKDVRLADLKLGPDGALYNGIAGMPSLKWTVYSNYASAKVTVKYKDFWNEEWELRVYRKDFNADTKQADGWVNVAWLYGEGIEGEDNGFEIREASASTWTKVDAAYITHKGAAFQARVPHLKAETAYVCRAYSGTDYGRELEFTTGTAVPLPDGSLDNWHKKDVGYDKYLWNPWAENADKYWDTGNRGATTVGNSNSVPTTDVWNPSLGGKAAMLESRYIVIKFAAGNLFLGDYVRTNGTDGVLSFGRPFTERPTRVKGYFKYKTSIINRLEKEGEFDNLKGRPDSCFIYAALGDWDTPVEIRTKKSERKLFDKNDPHIIAYTEFISGDDIPQYRELDLPFEYRSTNRVPKYLVLVCTASKYGDYFTGGEGSTLWVDDFSLEYDY